LKRRAVTEGRADDLVVVRNDRSAAHINWHQSFALPASTMHVRWSGTSDRKRRWPV